MDIRKRNVQGLDLLEVPGTLGAPAVLLFHGYGADAEDLLPLAQGWQEAEMKPHFFFPTGPLDVPIAPGYMGKGWFPVDIEILKLAIHEHKSKEIIKAFPREFSQVRAQCQDLIAELDIPLSKLFLGGFSQGAILATEVALNFPEKVAALLLLSGTLVNEESWRKQAQFHKGMAFFQSHGQQDTLLPFDRAQALERLFLDAGFEGKLHAFHGGHEIPHSIISQLNAFLKHKAG